MPLKDCLGLIEWINVPAGPFVFGTSREKCLGAELEEMPSRTIILGAYDISKTPITFHQWNLIDSSSIRVHKSEESRPVTNVSWFDCKTFSELVSEKIGSMVALPSEFQWEKAMRGPENFQYPWGDIDSELGPLEAGEPYHDGSISVESPIHAEYGYGCTNIFSNVFEWCLNWYDGDLHSKLIENVHNPGGPENGEFRAFRGGNPLMGDWPRLTSRGFQRPEYKNSSIGFRLVREPGTASEGI